MAHDPQPSAAAPRRLGFATGYDAAAPVAEMATQVAEAEAAGFDIGFFSETFFTNRDSVSALSAFAGATKSILLGTTQVVRLRSPLLMAQTAATLDELSGGRFVLVVGACTDKHARRNGLKPLPPAEVLIDYITSIRLLLRGEPVSYEGKHVVLDNVGLNWTPPRRDLPIWVAAATPLGLRIAGEHGDGVLLDAGTSPEYVSNALDIVATTRQGLQLGMEGFSVAQLINTSIASTIEAAVDAVRWEVASKFRYASTARGKVLVGEPNIDAEAPERLSTIFATDGADALSRAIPDDFVRALTASGDVDEVVSRIESYRRAGVTTPLLRAAAASQIPQLLAMREALG